MRRRIVFDEPPDDVIAIDQISKKRSEHNELMEQLLATVFEIGSLHCRAR